MRCICGKEFKKNQLVIVLTAPEVDWETGEIYKDDWRPFCCEKCAEAYQKSNPEYTLKEKGRIDAISSTGMGIEILGEI